MDYGNGFIIEKASALYSKSSIVLDKCVPIGVKLAVENLNTNAWAGSITANGNPMTCTNCDVGKSTTSIVLDGDNTSGGEGYERKTYGKCSSYITSLATCSAAATSLGFSDKTAISDLQYNISYDPLGCYSEKGTTKFNNNGNYGSCSSTDICLCLAPTKCMNGKKCLLTYPNGNVSVDCTTTDCNAEWIGKFISPGSKLPKQFFFNVINILILLLHSITPLSSHTFLNLQLPNIRANLDLDAKQERTKTKTVSCPAKRVKLADTKTKKPV